jgi:hypothetical protein
MRDERSRHQERPAFIPRRQEEVPEPPALVPGGPRRMLRRRCLDVGKPALGRREPTLGR